MSVSTSAFWKLLSDSRLLGAEHCQQLQAEFGQVRGATEQGNAKPLAEWLVSRNVLSRYQSTILLAGRSGPFNFGEYKVYDRVEKGRLAGQFRAVHAPTGHPVMLQFLTGPIIQDAGLWAAAANEALAGCAITSPHLQKFFEPVDLVSFKFLVSEDLRGAGLDERLAVGRFPVPEACRLARMAALGLAQLHQAGRVHGDVRPANIFLEAIQNHPGNVKLLFEPHLTPEPIDFNQQDPAGKLAARADYLAPELLHGGRLPDPLSDIYSLGCTLYCLLAGSPPFAGGNVQQKMARHAQEAIRPLEQFGVPQPLAQLVAYMMAKNPAVRYQAATIVAEQLAPLVDPSLLYLPGALPPQSLPNYENWILQKQAHLNAQATAPKPVQGPALNLELGPKFEAKASSASSAAGIKVNASKSAAELAELKHKKNLRLLIGGLSTAGVLAIGAIVALNTIGKGKKPDEPPKLTAEAADDGVAEGPIARSDRPSTTPVSSSGGKAANPDVSDDNSAAPGAAKGIAAADPSFVQQVQPDDGQLLWASPTTGSPVSFRYVPPAPQVLVVARPSDLLATGEGERVLQALGPAFTKQREAWEAASGLKLAEIDQLIIGLHNNDAKFPRVSLVVRTKEPLTTEQLLEKWGNPAAQKEGPATYYTGQGWAYLVATSPDSPQTFVMGDPLDVKEVAKSDGMPPLLHRDVERLSRSTDDQRHVSVLFYPHFFFNDDGEPLFAAERQKVRQPLSWLLGDDVKAGLVSLQFGDAFYFEMRMIGSLDKEKHKLAAELRDRLAQIPTSLENYFVSLTPPPYWKKIAFRYPGMVNALHGNMRVGVENDQAIVNSLLPGAAAHNLVLGGELLISSAPGTAVAVASAAPAAAEGPKTIEEVLKLNTSYSFDSQSLEFAMRDLAEDVKTNLLKGSSVDFAIKIIGDDLKLDGITRNQTVRDFKQDNKPISEILTALVMKANPVTTVKDPSEADQKLLWVVGPDPENPQKQIVLITTRQMSEKKMYKLPAHFQLK